MPFDASQNSEAEIELLRRISQGDVGSFEAFYDRFSGVLFATAYRVLNNQEAAEDVLQEVFLQIWEKAALYDPRRARPVSWVVTLARHKAIDRLRSAQRRGRMQENAEHEAKALAQFQEHDSSELAAVGEVGKLVGEAVALLTPEQREVIELAFYSSLTQSEIAERLNEPLGTVKARIRRGLLKLRELLRSRL